MKRSNYKERLKKYQQLAKRHRAKLVYARVSAAILTILWLTLVLVVAAALIGCADKPAIIYKTKEVKVPVRCNIEMPALPKIESLPSDTVATNIAKSFEEHRQALRCCIYGICD